MIVCDLNVMGVSFFPAETKPPPIVDANGPLASPITFQGVQLVAGWEAKRVQSARRMKKAELLEGPLLDGPPGACGCGCRSRFFPFPCRQSSGSPDHHGQITPCVKKKSLNVSHAGNRIAKGPAGLPATAGILRRLRQKRQTPAFAAHYRTPHNGCLRRSPATPPCRPAS